MPTYDGFSSAAAGDVSAAFEALGPSIRRLSTGLRIVGAADDAAGLAVRELMRADLATTRQVSRNVQDGISMLQTADGSAGVAHHLLTRVRELTTQASNGTLSDQQKNIIQQEVNQLTEEIGAIGQRARFNDIGLFENGQTIEVALGDGDGIAFDTEALPTLNIDVVNDPEGAAAAVDAAIEQVSRLRGRIGATTNRLQSAGEVIDIEAENILAAESRISDVDVAREVATLTRNQVIAQGAIAAQSHANTITQVVTMLLG